MSHWINRVATATLLTALAAPAQAATVTVNTAQDVLNSSDGLCSLREAITAVNTASFSGNVTGECAKGDGSGDMIALPAGNYTLSIAGTDENNNASGDLDIRASVMIQGAGMSTTTVDANSIDRAFDLAVGGIHFALRDLAVENGHAPDGTGGNGESGGAMNNANGADVSLTRVELAFNHAGAGTSGMFPGGGGLGGAIYSNGGSLLLLGCSVHDNASGPGGNNNSNALASTGGNGGNGGALAADNSGIGVERSTFERNRTGDGGSGILIPGQSGFGGGIYANGGILMVLQSAFDSNQTSSQASGGQGAGGGIFVYTATTRISQSSLTRNTAFDGGGLDSGDSSLSLDNVTLSGNYAGQFGGGLFVFGGTGRLDFVTLSDNQAGIDSGGARIENGNSGAATVSLRNSIMAGNSAPSLPDCNVLSGNTLTSQGYNVVGDSCPGNAIGDVATDNPHLGPLGDNGGIGLTQMPQPNGPVVDGGNCLASSVSVDQRSAARFVDVPRAPDSADACDIGAVELDDDVFWSSFDD